MQNISPM